MGPDVRETELFWMHLRLMADTIIPVVELGFMFTPPGEASRRFDAFACSGVSRYLRFSMERREKA